jgi:glycosyltransferase involved in cell wall biosynthesis
LIDITVIVRTRDEERRIAQFCVAYKDATRILVADGGSTDRTKEIANKYPNVIIRDYDKRIYFPNGMWRNPESDHINFLLAWAHEYNSDWIIFDDCDCRPNFLLKQNYRQILENTSKDFILVTRLYLWTNNQHFVFLAKPNQIDYEPSLWAWRGELDFWAVNMPVAFEFRLGEHHVKDLHKELEVLDLMPPYCLLHFSWMDQELLEKKLKQHRESGFIPGQKHPLDYGSPLEDLPEWAHE